jgi:hypothetical protein
MAHNALLAYCTQGGPSSVSVHVRGPNGQFLRAVVSVLAVDCFCTSFRTWQARNPINYQWFMDLWVLREDCDSTVMRVPGAGTRGVVW